MQLNYKSVYWCLVFCSLAIIANAIGLSVCISLIDKLEHRVQAAEDTLVGHGHQIMELYGKVEK